jgi:ribosomal protein S18 acetylase RimI-like enzyme
LHDGWTYHYGRWIATSKAAVGLLLVASRDLVARGRSSGAWILPTAPAARETTYDPTMHMGLPGGYGMRAATLDDIPAVVAVGRACDLEDFGEVDFHEDFLLDDWRRPRFDATTDTWVVTEPGGEVVAFASTWDEEPFTIFDSAGWVHPRHRGRGIGTALVLAVERRAERDLAKVPASSAARVHQSFDADAPGARSLFERHGYTPEREFQHMEIEVLSGFDAGGPPGGIAIRPRTEADDAGIFTVMDEGFRQHWGYRPEPYEEWLSQWLASATYDPSLWFVALEGDEIVGALQGNVTDGRGWVGDLAVRDAWRRRGIGEALLRAAFVRFRERDVTTVMLNVDRDNTTGATRLYERAGMRLRRSWLVVAKTLTAAPQNSTK